MSKGRVVLAMSGGVDSSVCAHLLVEQGYDVLGLFMRTGAVASNDACETTTPSRKTRGCCSALDAEDARRIADRLDIPFYSLNFSDEFGQIQDYFVEEYLHGRTPNPCVVCNTWLKFGKLWEYAEAVQADAIATGHYARILPGESGTSELHTAVDSTKDQSYFLFGVRRQLLSRMIFPIGNLPKTEVRCRAAAMGLAVANKPDSQEICFVPSGRYQDFIKKRRPEAEPAGQIVDPNGTVLAEHVGVSNFTIGQRKGLGVAAGSPRYVVEIQAEERRVVIGPRELLARNSFEAERVNWLLRESTEPIRCEVKIRYLHNAAKATVHPFPDRRARVQFDEPQSSITPGQATVFYDGSRVLGGGWIV